MFTQMLVVDLVCFTQSTKVSVVSSSEPFDTLVNKNVMDKKVSGTIGRNASTTPKWPAELGEAPNKHGYGYAGKKHSEQIVFFKHPISRTVVVFMQKP